MGIQLLKRLIILLALTQLFSCKKDKDESGPSITFTSPVENQFYNVFDNVPVKADISDDTKITSVSVTLVDAQKASANHSVSVSVSSPSMAINVLYPLDNIHLESGVYYIMITASDGTNDSRKYQKIYLGAVPKVLSKISVVTTTSLAQTDLSFVDSTFSTLVPYHTFTGDYLGTSVSTYYQQVFMCGNYTGSYTSMELENNSIKFSVAPLISGAPYFTAYYSEDKNNYVGRFDGFIRGYTRDGDVFYTASAISGYYPRKMCMNDGYLIAEEKDKTSPGKILVTYYQSGTSQQQKPIAQDVVALCEKDDNNVFVFGNDAGQGVIQLFDRINNNLWNPYFYPLATGPLLSAVKIDADTYLIGHSNGTIYKYQYTGSSVTTYLTGYTARQLKYDELNNRIYIVEANKISSVDYPSTTPVNSLVSADTIQDIGLIYNR